MQTKPIILVSGDPNSVFFEILFKTLKKKKLRSPLILICCRKLLLKQMKFFNYKKKINIISRDKVTKLKIDNKNLNIININLITTNNKYKNNIHLNNYLKNSFNLALRLIKDGVTNKFINGPINKKDFLDKKHLGITEYISKKFKRKNIGMLIYNKKLSVCPLTTHLPIKLVSKNVTRKLVSEKIEIIDSFFKKHLNVKAKIAVTGLNPHCESILKFNEDEKILPRVIKMKNKKGINVKGPYSADTIFLKNNRKKFNVILGMYHDQVLGPIKSLFEYDAINITMGLPFLRISPDHGPNTKMFKKNKSSPDSLIRALEFLDKR